MTDASARPRVVLVRHGETEWSRTGRHTGSTDVPLTAEGERRARALAPVLAGHPFALVLTSPLARARDTCRLAGLAAQAAVEPDLQEWDYGAMEGRSTPEIRAERPGWLLWRDGVADGETVDAVGARADRVIDRALAAGGDVCCFAHGHVLRILAARWLELPARAGQRFGLEPASISVLGWEHEYRVVREWNRAAAADGARP